MVSHMEVKMANKLVVVKNIDHDNYICMNVYDEIRGVANSPIGSIIDYGKRLLEREKDGLVLPKKASREKSKLFNNAPLKFKEYFNDFNSAEFEIAFNFDALKTKKITK